MVEMNKSKANFGEIRHHYWEWMIATYLFLGGLGGGILGLTAILTFFVAPFMTLESPIQVQSFIGTFNAEIPINGVMPEYATQLACAWPCFIALVCIAIGLVLLVLDLGQPLVFYRAFIKSTSVICWGARVLTVAFVFGALWWLSFIPWEWFAPIANFLAIFRDFSLALAGIGGICVVLYTGIFLSSLKAHSFWATPALPVLFTISAFSTACACIAISIGWWPMDMNYNVVNDSTIATLVSSGFATGNAEPLILATSYEAIAEIKHILHLVDVILVVCEIVVLLVMILSFLGAGNKTQNAAAHRWVDGSWKYTFWIGMVGIGLVLPEILYIGMEGTIASTVIAPICVLLGGLLLRFLIVYSDDRQPLPGEKIYYGRLVGDDAEFLHKWTYGKNIF